MASSPVIDELYEELVNNCRVRGGELTIPDYSDTDYENLYYTLLEALAQYIGDNYEFWYNKQCRSYRRYKARHTTSHDFYDPHTEKPMENHTIREQLAVLKYYLYRRYHSGYGRK